MSTTDAAYLREIASDASRFAGVDPARLRAIADNLDCLQNIERAAEYAMRELYHLDRDENSTLTIAYDGLVTALAAGPQAADELAQEFAGLKAENENARIQLHNYQRAFDNSVIRNERLRKIIRDIARWLTTEANSHEATDYGARCREQAARLLGEMNA
jgi:hypothetical protein